MRISDWSSDVCSSDLSDEFRARWNKAKGCWHVAIKDSRYNSIDELAKSLEAQLLAQTPEKWGALCHALQGLRCASEKFSIKIGASGLRVTAPTGHQIQRSIKKIDGAFLDRGNWFLKPKAAQIGRAHV